MMFWQRIMRLLLDTTFLYGANEEKGKVSETISEVVNLVMDAQGASNRAHVTNNISAAAG